MGYLHRKGRRKNSPPFVQLPKWMLNSEAWRGLSLAARAAYVEMERPYNGTNNGFIGMSVRYLAERLRCSKDTAARVLVELEDVGFIEATKIGKFSLKNRKASEYRLTIHRCDLSGHLPSKKFMHELPRSDRKDRLVRLQGHAKQNCRPQSDKKDRQPENRPANSPIMGTHLESYHGGTGTADVSLASRRTQDRASL
jgi:hypothetical protein